MCSADVPYKVIDKSAGVQLHRSSFAAPPVVVRRATYPGGLPGLPTHSAADRTQEWRSAIPVVPVIVVEDIDATLSSQAGVRAISAFERPRPPPLVLKTTTSIRAAAGGGGEGGVGLSAAGGAVSALPTAAVGTGGGPQIGVLTAAAAAAPGAAACSSIKGSSSSNSGGGGRGAISSPASPLSATQPPSPSSPPSPTTALHRSSSRPTHHHHHRHHQQQQTTTTSSSSSSSSAPSAPESAGPTTTTPVTATPTGRTSRASGPGKGQPSRPLLRRQQQIQTSSPQMFPRPPGHASSQQQQQVCAGTDPHEEGTSLAPPAAGDDRESENRYRQFWRHISQESTEEKSSSSSSTPSLTGSIPPSTPGPTTPQAPCTPPRSPLPFAAGTSTTPSAPGTLERRYQGLSGLGGRSPRDVGSATLLQSPPIQRVAPRERELIRWSSASGPGENSRQWPGGTGLATNRVPGHMSSPLAGTPMAARSGARGIHRITPDVRNSHPDLRYASMLTLKPSAPSRRHSHGEGKEKPAHHNCYHHHLNHHQTGRATAEDMAGPHDGQRRHLVSSGLGHQQVALTPQVGALPASSAAAAGGATSGVEGGGREEAGGGGGGGARSANNTGSAAGTLYDLKQQHQQHQQAAAQRQQQLQQAAPQQAQSHSQCGPALGYPQPQPHHAAAFPAVPPYIRQQSAMQFCYSQDKPPLSKTFSLPHDYDSQKPLGHHKPFPTAAEAAFGAAFPTSTVTRRSDGISCPNLGRRPEVSYRKDKMATSEETQSLLSELVSEEDSSYSLFDITGPSGQARFPWQRDVAVQTDCAAGSSSTAADAASSTSSSAAAAAPAAPSSGLWSSGGTGPWKQDTQCGGGGGKCVLQNQNQPGSTMKRSSISMQEGLCLEVPPFEGVSVSTPALHHQDPWTSLENIPILPDPGSLTAAHGTECRLYCSLHNTEKSYRCGADGDKDDDHSEPKKLLRPTNLGLHTRRGSASKWFAENEGPLQDRTYRADSLVSPPPGVYPRYARIIGNGPGFPEIETPSSSDLGERSDTLSSPRVSPVPWLSQGQSVPELVITSTSDSQDGQRRYGLDSGKKGQRYLTVPKPVIRRATSGSLQSVSDESDTEPSTPPVARRGRRPAVFDSKSLGLAASHLDDISPSNSCDEGDGSGGNIPQDRLGRKRSSVDLGINYPGDLLVKERQRKQLIKRNTIADFAATKTFQASTQSLISEQETKKLKVPSIFKLIEKKSHRSKDSLTLLTDVLNTLKPSAFRDTMLMCYKDVHWTDLVSCGKDTDSEALANLPEMERKRREAVWELFRSETVFLVDYLMVLKHCFLEPLKKVSVEGHLMFAEPQDLFGNLDELCYVSYTFCRDFINLLLKEASPSEFGRTEILIQALTRYCQLSRDGEVYHNYCLNYSKAMNHMEQVRKKDDWLEFEKWCEQDLRCHRLQLTDLLISPMQHCTKVPLLLNNIRKYTEDPDERQKLTENLNKLETSLKNLEAKMKWLKNFERVQQIQQQIIWQPITELEPRAFIPEFLKASLCRQPCERLLASPKRQLLYEGPLTLVEISKTVDMYLFLFDDILLLTKVKKPPRKKSSLGDTNNPMMSGRGSASTEGAVFVVYRQPIALDRFTLHDVQPAEAAANGLRHAFVLVQISRFQQIIGVYTLQAPSETAKAMWLSHLKDAQDKYKEACLKNPDGHGFQSSPGSPRGSLVPELLRPHNLLDRTQSSPMRTFAGLGKGSPVMAHKREFGGAGSLLDVRSSMTDAQGAAVNQAVSTTTLAEIAIQEHQNESDSSGSGAAAGETDTPPMSRAAHHHHQHQQQVIVHHPQHHTGTEPGTSAGTSGSSSGHPPAGFYSPQLLRPQRRGAIEMRSISPPPTPGRPRNRPGRRLNTLRALHEKAKSMDIVFGHM